MSFDLVHDIKPVSYVKSHTADMLKYIAEKQSPIVITQNGEAKAVLLDVKSYQKMIDAMTMLKLIKAAEKDMVEGRVIDSEKVFSDIRAQIAK